MNFNFSLFGQSAYGGISQYPVFTSSSTLRSAMEEVKGRQLTIERSERVMVYTFIQRLSARDTIGFRISVNDMQFSKSKGLMDYLSELVDILITQGQIVRLDDTGIVYFRSSSEHKARITTLELQTGFAFAHNPQRFGLDKLHGTPQSIVMQEADYAKNSDSEIEAMTYQSRCVRIIDASETEQLYISGIIHNITYSLEATKAKNGTLEKENAKLRRAKKQFTTVICMLLLICGGAIWLYSLKGDLDNTKLNLDDANERISTYSQQIDSLQTLSTIQQDDIDKLHSKLNRFTNAANNLRAITEYPGWISTNGHRHDSESHHKYNFYCYPGDQLIFDYYVDSEGADYFRYEVYGAGISRDGKNSGASRSDSIIVTFTDEGSVTLWVSYEKDGSVHHYSDQAVVSNVRIIRGDIKRLQGLISE